MATDRNARSNNHRPRISGIGTRNVIAFRCRERYFGARSSGLNRRSIRYRSMAQSRFLAAQTYTRATARICMLEWICICVTSYAAPPERRARYPSWLKIGETREISRELSPLVPFLPECVLLYFGHVNADERIVNARRRPNHRIGERSFFESVPFRRNTERRREAANSDIARTKRTPDRSGKEGSCRGSQRTDFILSVKLRVKCKGA